MGKASRDKGKRGEREARDACREYWGAAKCRRAQQYCGADSTADLLNALPECHVEVKRYKRITATDFMDQAVTDSSENEVPVVLMREDKGTWLVVLRIEDSKEFATRLLEQLGGSDDG